MSGTAGQALEMKLLSTDSVQLDASNITQRSKRTSVSDGTIFMVGFALYLGGYISDVVGTTVLQNPTLQDTKRDPEDFSQWLYACAQTVGLITTTFADLDIDRYLSCNSVRLLLILFVWGVYYAYNLCSGTIYGAAVPLLPFVYIVLRFHPITQMERGYPRLTELFVLILALDFVGIEGGYGIQYYTSSPRWPAYVIAIYNLGSGVVVLFVYQWSKAQKESPTISFNTAVYTYLFLLGLGFVLYCSVMQFVWNLQVPLGMWMVAPIHLVPTILMAVFRRFFFRKLGESWIQKRLKSVAGTDFSADEFGRGNLIAVNAAIACSADLNALCERPKGSVDKFTLLMYASGNGFVDAIELLLSQEHIVVNYSSPTRGE
jgi:hypothetical protein